MGHELIVLKIRHRLDLQEKPVKMIVFKTSIVEFDKWKL